MINNSMHLRFDIPNDMIVAGEASSTVKKTLVQMGIPQNIIKKAVISMYEAEINAVIHGGGGYSEVTITDESIIIKIADNGPGIPDVDLALKAGWSTATDEIRALGFGAGMGLPNISRYADKFRIETKMDRGATIIMEVSLLE